MTAGFRFGFKVTDVLTVEKVPNLARFGAKAGQPNPNFLNTELFATAFLKPSRLPRAVGPEDTYAGLRTALRSSSIRCFKASSSAWVLSDTE